MFEKLIEYQRLDGKILSIKRDLEKNEAKVTLNKVVALVKDAQAKLIELENKAKATLLDFDKCQAEYELSYNELVTLTKKDVSSLTEEEANAQLEKINRLAGTLSQLERALSVQAESVGAIIKNFEVCRSNIMTYKQKYKESKERVDSLQKDLIPQVEQIKKQMQELEKQIDSNMLSKYKHLRQDKIFPAFVPLNNNACGGCSMALPSALMTKLKEDGYLECEQCRRYIYLS